MAASGLDQHTSNPVDTIGRADALYATGDWTRAEEICRTLLGTQIDCFEALNLLGMITGQTGRSGEAAQLLQRAIATRPTDACVVNNYGNALTDLRRFDEALASYARALEINPRYAEAHCNQGNVLFALARREEALASYERALEVNPNCAEAWHNRGLTLSALGRGPEALSSYQRALALNPRNLQVWFNQANALKDMGRKQEALASYERALEMRPDLAEAHINRGNILQDLGEFAEALASYERALAIRPDCAAVCLSNRGNALRHLKRFEEALASYARALEIRPHHPWLRGSWFEARMRLCEWSDLDSHITQLLGEVSQGRQAATPFTLLALTDSPGLQRQATEIWVRDTCPVSSALPAMGKRVRRERIRLGYYSADFCNHATAYLAAELIELHDRSRFEVMAFSFGPESTDHMRRRLAAAFDRFIDVRTSSDTQVAELSRQLGIDIAVDLKGFTEDARPGIFAHRAAPVQASYLGYPGTTGAPYFDYLIADQTVIPPESRRHYAEQVVYLPHSYQVNDRKRQIADRVFTRAELGLPSDALVFCCFNDPGKITPQTFDGWMRILRQVPGGMLWLLSGSATAEANLRREAGARGVDPTRLAFAPRWPLAEHLARQRAADLFLDTFPCNAHTTASDALWAGLPVLTRMGESFASRVAASLLNAVGLPELITRTPEQFEALAVGLARDRERLATIRQKLQRNRLTAPLFDSTLFTRHLEAAYIGMYERSQAGLNPEAIVVSQTLTPADALQSHEHALALNPLNAQAWSNRGNALKDLHRPLEALASYERALEIRPDLAEAHIDRGNLLEDLGRFDEALSSYEQALAVRPEGAWACYNNRGNVLRRLKRFDEALENFGRALEIRPDHPWLRANWLQLKMQLSSWDGVDSQIGPLVEDIRRGRRTPFTFLALVDSPELQRQAAEAWVRDACPPSQALPAMARAVRHNRIRIGYYSADFYDHATAYLAAELIELHDRDRFEVLAFSYGPDVDDHMRRRLVGAFDRFIDVRTRSDREVAELSRDLEIDIAVDLKGFTGEARTGIFSYRTAPVQASYLGYPGTMGAPYFDYLIADPTVIPPETRRHYAEQVVYLPHSYQVNDRKRPIAERAFSRAELGLPADGFVFCCLNSNHKITPQTFDGWMRILRRVPRSVLWLLADSPTAQANLRREAETRGVDGGRLVFAPFCPLSEHLARQRAADLFLDTLPYNAHTTASDALWAGVPVLTRVGESFPARVSASLLNAVGLPELITTTGEQYEQLAAELATFPQRLSAIREKLQHNRLTTPLFDTALFTRHLEIAYGQMYERWQAALSPEDLWIPAH
jgi:predicted O-linked N-acetylglucosamine transferase (SPINDLY family)